MLYVFLTCIAIGNNFRTKIDALNAPPLPKPAASHTIEAAYGFATEWELAGDGNFHSSLSHTASSTFTADDSGTQTTLSVTNGEGMSYTTCVNVTKDYGLPTNSSTLYPVSPGTPVTIPNGIKGYLFGCNMSFSYTYTKCTNPVPQTGYCYASGPATVTGTNVQYLIGLTPLAPIVTGYYQAMVSESYGNEPLSFPLRLMVSDPNVANGLSFQMHVRVYYQAGQHNLSTFTSPTLLEDTNCSYDSWSLYNDTLQGYEQLNGTCVKLSKDQWEPLPHQLTFGIAFFNDVGEESAKTLIYVELQENLNTDWLFYLEVGLAIAGVVVVIALFVRHKVKQSMGVSRQISGRAKSTSTKKPTAGKVPASMAKTTKSDIKEQKPPDKLIPIVKPSSKSPPTASPIQELNSTDLAKVRMATQNLQQTMQPTTKHSIPAKSIPAAPAVKPRASPAVAKPSIPAKPGAAARAPKPQGAPVAKSTVQPAAKPAVTTKRCPACTTILPADAKFCNACGYRF